VPSANIDNASGVLIPVHVAYCINVSGLVTCTFEGWDLEVCNAVFLRRIVLGRKFLRRARLLFLSHFLLHCGGAGLFVSFPEGRVWCSPGHALEPDLCVFFKGRALAAQ